MVGSVVAGQDQVGPSEIRARADAGSSRGLDRCSADAEVVGGAGEVIFGAGAGYRSRHPGGGAGTLVVCQSQSMDVMDGLSPYS